MTCPTCRQPATLAGVNWRCAEHGNLVRHPEHRLAGITVSGGPDGSHATAHCACGHTEDAATLYEASDRVMDHAVEAAGTTPAPTPTPTP